MFLQASPSLIKSRKPTDSKLDYSHIAVSFSLLGLRAVVYYFGHLLLFSFSFNSLSIGNQVMGEDSYDGIR